MCDSPHLRAGRTLKHGSGSLMEPRSTKYTVVSTLVNAWTSQQIETSGGGSLVTDQEFFRLPDSVAARSVKIAP
jgi:hypothetical protein